MRYAKIKNKEQLSEVTFSGELAYCPDCNSLVIGHKGEFKIKHWKHHKRTNCDSWYEPITAWHISWQNLFSEKFREVTITKESIKHRADIRLNNGLVIEIQNSPIKSSEIEARENFYGQHNMIWILNGKTLAAQSQIQSKFVKRQMELYITIPYYLEELNEYNVDEFREAIFDTEIIKNVKALCHDCKVANGTIISFYFIQDIDLYNLKSQLNWELKKVFGQKYGYDAIRDFILKFFVEAISIKQDHYEFIRLTKRHWRKFIDVCTFPVFFDNFNGLDDDKLYWYQENKIISKEKFLKKYHQYCL